jgi:hypothetical protein
MVRTLLADSAFSAMGMMGVREGDGDAVTEGVTLGLPLLLPVSDGERLLLPVSEGEAEVEGVTVGVPDAAGEVEGVAGTAPKDGDADGDAAADADSDTDADGDGPGETLLLAPALPDTDGDVDSDTDVVAVTEVDTDTEAEGERDAVGDAPTMVKYRPKAVSAEVARIWCTSTAMMFVPTTKNCVGSNSVEGSEV